jgi:hypothetical protein
MLMSHTINTRNTMSTYTQQQIREMLENNDKAVARGVAAIFKYQTHAEQASHTTRENNGVGFNGVDAEILSSFAEFYNKTGFLTPKQTALARKKILKYAGQLTRIANKEI